MTVVRNEGNRVPRLHPVGRHVDLVAVHSDVPAHDELTRLGEGARESEPIEDIVEPELEQVKEHLAGHVETSGSLAEESAELALAESVEALRLLLLAELEPVLGQARAAPPVLAGWG
jgi:hypothetical protein